MRTSHHLFIGRAGGRRSRSLQDCQKCPHHRHRRRRNCCSAIFRNLHLPLGTRRVTRLNAAGVHGRQRQRRVQLPLCGFYSFKRWPYLAIPFEKRNYHIEICLKTEIVILPVLALNSQEKVFDYVSKSYYL